MKKMLKELEQWLRTLNESAADSLLEAMEEILTLHRLKVPALLRKTLHSTNPIESVSHRSDTAKKTLNATATHAWRNGGWPASSYMRKLLFEESKVTNKSAKSSKK